MSRTRGGAPRTSTPIREVSRGEGPKAFFDACERVEIPPTLRQLSKWRRRTGRAYQEGRR